MHVQRGFMLLGIGFTCNNYHTGMHAIICVICCSVKTVNWANNKQGKIKLDWIAEFTLNYHHTVIVVAV